MSTATSVPGVHVRVQNDVVGNAEKRVLIWIAERLPARVTSDRLFALALVSMAAVGASFAAFPITKWAALGVIAGLVANWFGDSLDGTLARVRCQQRPRYGFYVDHAIDIAGTAFLFGGLACSGVIAPIVALGLLGAYLLVAAETFLATHATAIFRMSFVGIGPTELRLLLIAGALKLLDTPWMSLGSLGPVRLFDLGGGIAIVGLLIVFVVSAVQNTRALYAAEPLPARVSQARVG